MLLNPKYLNLLYNIVEAPLIRQLPCSKSIEFTVVTKYSLLRSTFIQTPNIYGEQLQTGIQNMVGPWKAGKCMPLTLWPHSAKNYALPRYGLSVVV